MRRGSLLPAVVITTLAVFLTGCSRNPVAPTLNPTVGPGAGSTVISSIPDDPPPSDGGTPSSRTVMLATTDEGLVSVGRWTLWIRKNSLKMPATITMHVSDPEAMEVQIEVQPAEANDFASPAVLTASLSDLQSFDYSTGTLMYWSNDWQWSTDTSSHPNQQNIVGHFKSLTDTRVSDGADKWKNKLGA
jgi:hypothetical protein